MNNFPGELPVDKGRTLILEPSILLLCFAENFSVKQLPPDLKNLGIEIIDNPGGSHLKGNLINNTKNRVWIRTANRTPFTDGLLQAIQKAFKSLQWIGPAYRSQQSRESEIVCPLPNVLIITMKDARKAKSQEFIPDFNNGLADNDAGSFPQLTEVVERSAYLNGRHYFEIGNPLEWDAYTVRNLLMQKYGGNVAEVLYEKMPLISPLAFVPNDTYFTNQWNLTQINAPQGWDITTGAAGVTIAILDTGCDLTHPDLSFAGQGINCTTMAPPGSPAAMSEIGHGTCTAGIAAAIVNNSQGVSGVAGNCKVLPLAIVSFSDAEIAFGINYAVDHGAVVISMSFGGTMDSSVIDTALDYALTNDVVLCASAGNYNLPSPLYPSAHPGVMSVAATDQSDNRKTSTSPDGECWGSNYGDGLSVGAPGVLVWSTDIQGTGGFNDNSGAPIAGPCVTYPSSGDAAGNYFQEFNGTSAAAPHVSGFAALLRSQYSGLSGVQVRNIIERTADKVGTTPYAINPAYPNGTWNNQLGYGRINIFRGLDFADVLIKDFPADTGAEPRTPPGGDFWDYADIVVRPADDGFFNPSLLAQARNVVRGLTNYIYVRVTNNGPNAARNVVVNVRITPYVGTEFVAGDWAATDATHVVPTNMINTFASIPSGAQVMAKFSIDATQVETLYGWETADPWHPCLLALVQADNDYAFNNANTSAAVLPIQINNYAQRNLSVISTGSNSPQGFEMTFPFVAGNKLNMEEVMGIRIDRSSLPEKAMLYLLLDEDGSAFPAVDFTYTGDSTNADDNGLEFVEKTKIRTKLGCCEGILTLEKGSRFDCECNRLPSKATVVGGEIILKDGKRQVRIVDSVATITLSKNPGQLVPLAIRLQTSGQAAKGDVLFIPVSQLDQKGQVVGGAGVAYVAD